jgi:hypothetical protein
VEKVLFLLQEGFHVMVVDVISLPRMPVRLSLLTRLGLEEPVVETGQLWASSCCSLPGDAPHPQIVVREWAAKLTIGEPLPSLPLFLQTDQLWVPVDLEKSYQETLEAGRYDPV